MAYGINPDRKVLPEKTGRTITLYLSIFISMKIHILFVGLILLCFSCKNQPSGSNAAGAPIPLKYAENLVLFPIEDYTIAQLRNPWDTTKILHTYILVPKEKKVPTHLPEGTVVKIPLSKAIVYSSVHCSLLRQLGSITSIVGVCDLQYIKIPEIQEGCSSGKIADLGSSMNPDIEKIIDIHPDAILLSPFENSGGYGRIEKLDVPIIECADYMETSPLGRAEWMRFYGLLFGQAATADSLFSAVTKEYKRLCQLALTAPSKPSVISELRSGSAWYVPGGKSTMGQLYSDAGARYLWSDDPRSGSVPLAFEVVFDQGHEADFWLIKYNQQTDKTLRELKSDYAPYAKFKAFKEKNVYGCNTGKVAFYEESPFHPELLLKDLISIFHPELVKDYQAYYFQKLTE